MIYEAPSSITFRPDGGGADILLLAEDGSLTALPAMETSQEMLEAEGIYQASALFRPLGRARVNITFETESSPAASHDVAQTGWLAAERVLAAELMELRGSLIFETASQTATYAPAVIAAVRPSLPFGPESVLRRRYEIRAALPEIAI